MLFRSMEREFADTAIPIIEKTGKMIAKKFLEINGYELPMIEAGIYWRKDTMQRELGKDEEKELQKERFTRPGIFKGMAIKRTKASLPVWLKPFSVATSEIIKRAADYTALEEAMGNAAWLLYKTRSEIESRYGQPLWKEIEKGLKDISEVYSQENATWAAKAFKKIRNNYTVYALALNYGTMLKQLNGPFNNMVFVGPGYMARAAAKYIQSPAAARKMHREMSVQYRKRAQEGFSYDVQQVLSSLNQYGQAPSTIQRVGAAGLAPLRQVDLFGVDLGMLGAVEQALDQFESGEFSPHLKQALDVTPEQVKKMSHGERYKLAYKWADWVIERTQAQFSPEHMSGWQRGSELEKQFAMFFSELGKNTSGVYRAYKSMERGDPKAGLLMIKTLFFYAVIASMLTDSGVNALRAVIRGQKPDLWWVGFMKSILGHIPIVRDVADALLNMVQGKYFPAGGDTPASRLTEAFQKPVAAIAKRYKAKTHKERQDAWIALANALADFAAMSVGLPYPSLKEPFRIMNREETKRKQKN